MLPVSVNPSLMLNRSASAPPFSTAVVAAVTLNVSIAVPPCSVSNPLNVSV